MVYRNVPMQDRILAKPLAQLPQKADEPVQIPKIPTAKDDEQERRLKRQQLARELMKSL